MGIKKEKKRGPGRPEKEKTKVMRVPLSLVPKVLKMIGKHSKIIKA